MSTLRNIAFVFFLFTSFVQAQIETNSSKKSKKIEINNENGELSISILNDEISEFTVNDIAIAEDFYDDYQDIIDDFTNEEFHQSYWIDTYDLEIEDPVEEVRSSILDYLINEVIINSSKKYSIQLNRKFLKVNGKMMSQDIHNQCLDFFENVYGHSLTARSEAVFKKSKRSTKSSISIKS